MRSLFWLVSAVVMFGGGYVAYDRFTERQQLLESLAQRETAIARLSQTTRVARAMVKSRFIDEETGKLMSDVLFVEEGPDGERLRSVRALIEGETVYFDALVLKFDRGLVAEADPIKGKSVMLFRRIFGENQSPIDGVAIDEDAEDGIPKVYREGDVVSAPEMELWRDFWKYANDPDAAREAGVRVAQGEAPYVKMELGKLYELTLDHAGGLNVNATKIPAIFLDEDG